MHRTNIALAAAAVGLAALLAAPAAAQYGPPPPPPPQVPRPSEPAPAAPAAEPTGPAEVLRAVACTVGRAPDDAAALLATTPRSSEERTQAAAILRAAQRCVGSRQPIATSAWHARGAVAEALYEAQFATPAAARTPPLGAAPLPRPPASAEEIVTVLTPMYALVDCAMPRQPDLVRALLAAEPRSPEEQAGYTALNPHFIACVPPGTTQLSIDPRFVRNMFAEALYRWSVVQRDGPASPWAAAAAPAAPAAAPSGS